MELRVMFIQELGNEHVKLLVHNWQLKFHFFNNRPYYPSFTQTQ